MIKKLTAFVLMLSLCGCNGATTGYEKGMEVRQKLLESDGCSFVAVVNADFGQTEYSFKLDCDVSKDGELAFEVIAPESIANIKGRVDWQSGSLRFDDTVLAFPHLAEGEISPVCAPWLFYKALSAGYIGACGEEDGLWRMSIDDSFRGENLAFEVWMNQDNIPVSAEIVWQGRKLLSLQIVDFTFM